MKKTINQEHQKQVIEIAGYIFAKDEFQTADQILSNYANDSLEKEKNEKTIARSIRTLNEILGIEVIESKQKFGYRLKANYKNDLFWMLPLFSRYLAITEQESLNYVFEPIVHQLESTSLLNLFLLRLAKTEKRAIQIEYTKYGAIQSNQRKIHIYSIVQRDNKLLIVGQDSVDKQIKHFFFTSIKNIKLLEENFEEPDVKIIKEYYRNSIGIYKGKNQTIARIRFSSNSENFIYKEYFHRDQKIIKNATGFILELAANDKQEIFNIVSKFMRYAELLEPLDWREEFRQNIESLLKRHKKI